MKRELTHIIGGSLILSSFLNSDMGILPILNIIPILLVSFAVEKENEGLQTVGLIGMTTLSSYFIVTISLGDMISLIFFMISFVFPLILYWKVVLSFDLHFDPKASVLALAYLSATIVTFYALIHLLNIDEFILAPENTGPMSLAYSAIVIMVLIPVYISINR